MKSSLPAKTLAKMLLDIVMSVLFIWLTFGFGASAFFHEIAGIGIGLLFLLHIVWNIPTVRGLWHGCCRGTKRRKPALLLLLDSLLTVGMLLIIVTGVLIAQQIASFELGNLYSPLATLHTLASYTCLGILAIHLLLHARYLTAVFTAWIRNAKDTQLWKTVGGFAAAVLAVVVLYAATSSAWQRAGAAPTQTTGATSIPDSTSSQLSTPSKKEEESESTVTSPNSEQEDIPTLEDYLGKLYCTGCHRRCSLLSPQCGKGERQTQSARSAYSSTYGVTE